MNYDELIQTVSAIVENENIFKTGLTLIYELSDKKYKQLNEQLFYKSNPITSPLPETNDFEVEIGGILIKFIKTKIEEEI